MKNKKETIRGGRGDLHADASDEDALDVADGGDGAALFGGGNDGEARGGHLLRAKDVDDANVAEHGLILAADIDGT